MTVNKNTVPGEKRSPFVTSGVRIGTPAMTTRGMMTEHAVQVADWMADAIEARDDHDRLAEIAGNVRDLCRSLPMYSQDLLD